LLVLGNFERGRSKGRKKRRHKKKGLRFEPSTFSNAGVSTPRREEKRGKPRWGFDFDIKLNFSQYFQFSKGKIMTTPAARKMVYRNYFLLQVRN
jgi:hypothetical protein